MSNESENFAAHSGSPGPIDELQLIRYLDGRLEGAQKQAVEDLLRTNAAVRRRFDALREEETLLREALETLSEPSKRLSDKVVATLHTEERSRIQAIRNKRLRRNLVWGMSVAASFVLCVWLMKPRDSMGSAVAGTGGTVVLPSGERRPLGKNSSFYERDQIITAAGQFLRLRLSSEAQIDLDERSRLTVERSKPEAAFRLDAGRMGVLAAQQQDVLLHLPQGTVRVAAGSVVDVWLPVASRAEWPGWLMTAPSGTAPANADAAPAVLTVISGYVHVVFEAMPEGVSASLGNRIVFTRKNHTSRAIDLSGSRVVETRRGNSWHAAEGGGPQDRALVGLFETTDFKDLGARLGMAKNTPAPVAEALAQLHYGMHAAARAENLAAGQQALRAAYEPLASDDERRDFGRMLEGLAHLERGRALMAAKNSDTVAARAAFDAARVAFEEALRPDSGAAESKPDWARQIAAGSSVTLRELSPAAQSALLASFNHAVAQVWLAGTDAESKERMAEAAKEFEALRNDLSKSVEGMAARLAHGLVLQAGGRSDKAIEACAEVLAVPMAGWSDATRRYGDGLKQAALLAMARLYRQARQIEKLHATARDFGILYPLEENSPAALELQRELNAGLREAGDRDAAAGRYESAVEYYAEWIRANPAATPDAAAVHIQALKAAIAARNGAYARAEVDTLASGELKKFVNESDLTKLREQAQALPAATKPLDAINNPR